MRSAIYIKQSWNISGNINLFQYVQLKNQSKIFVQ